LSPITSPSSAATGGVMEATAETRKRTVLEHN
jgi:hypothetical protein